jgi:hypothetical protein
MNDSQQPSTETQTNQLPGEDEIQKAANDPIKHREETIYQQISTNTRIKDGAVILTIYTPSNEPFDCQALDDAIAEISESLIKNGYDFEYTQTTNSYNKFRITGKKDKRNEHRLVYTDADITQADRTQFILPIPNTERCDDSLTIFGNDETEAELRIDVGDVWYSRSHTDREKYWLIVGIQGSMLLYYDMTEGKFGAMNRSPFEDTIKQTFQSGWVGYIIPADSINL